MSEDSLPSWTMLTDATPPDGSGVVCFSEQTGKYWVDWWEDNKFWSEDGKEQTPSAWYPLPSAP